MGKHYGCLCLNAPDCDNSECPHGTEHAYFEEECHGYDGCTLDHKVACSIIATKKNISAQVTEHLKVL